MSALFALATSLLWGLADFGGGLLTRRTPALTVVVVSQTIAVTVLGAIVVATGGWSEAGPQLWFAAAAGVVGPAAMLCFYRALALGPMGVVSPLGALGGVVVPLCVALVLGERPGLLQVSGIVVAVAGVVLASGPQTGGAPVHRQTLLLTAVAALGFGSVMALIAEASTTLTGLFLALFVQRVCNVAVGGTVLLVSVRRGAPGLPEGGTGVVWASLPALAFVGLADVAANGTYSLAARHGPVTIAAVLASLYPVVTALAARGLLGERLRVVQATGAGLALVGTLLLATG
ncbi:MULTISPECIES: DMT family transporter [Streptomyces]|uniref:Drug/metabolite transporter (DMT)-like permease n=2 Tax=Streptomyces TaxID=1883 RepID=A0ABT9L339_9ACTN|nr:MULTISPECIES: DMT family transporter [Streptomyces]MBW8089659.1 DMT family transporter [Streptomyces hygroscopicus subsp. hygroscopicus]MCO8308371.1 DMT family transporter [Streptomyces sp. RKCA744]MDN3055091.1 DMT family transporter [Streptomyces sp. SRF1]MDP9615049.1 drug/metabolite transporter (DMT)-like permease [Streptomyces demainii]GHJ32937.1 membrane protein [Streptomyces hygroscopicus]